MKLHNHYLNEIEKLKVIAKMQYDDELITRSEYNKILFTLYDKLEIYKKNVIKVNIPKIEIVNYRNLNVINITDALFSG